MVLVTVTVEVPPLVVVLTLILVTVCVCVCVWVIVHVGRPPPPHLWVTVVVRITVTVLAGTMMVVVDFVTAPGAVMVFEMVTVVGGTETPGSREVWIFVVVAVVMVVVMTVAGAVTWAVLVLVAVVTIVLVDVVVDVIRVTSVITAVTVVVKVCTGPDNEDIPNPGRPDPEQRPYNGLQPAPQWSSVEPHQPEAEQQSLKEERWHVTPSEQRPSGLTSRLWDVARCDKVRRIRRMDGRDFMVRSRIISECLEGGQVFERRGVFTDRPVNIGDIMAWAGDIGVLSRDFLVRQSRASQSPGGAAIRVGQAPKRITEAHLLLSTSSFERSSSAY